MENFQALAVARGISLADVVRERLVEGVPLAPEPALLSGEAWESAFDQFFDSFPTVGPLPDEAFDRESIYGREDNW